jgi:trigger factor
MPGGTIVADVKNTGNENSPEEVKGEEVKEEKEVKEEEKKEEAVKVEDTDAAPEEEKPEGEEEKEEKVDYEIIEAIDKPGSIREYKVSLPWEEYDKSQQKTLKDLKKNVVIDGFRKGKAPIRFIKRRFKKELKSDILNEKVPFIAKDLLKKEERVQYSEPTFEELKVEEGEPVELKISIEVSPKIELKKDVYTGQELTVKKLKVTEELINDNIEGLRKRSAVYEPKEEGAVEETDGIIVNSFVTDEHGVEISNSVKKDFLIEEPAKFLPANVWKEVLGKKKGANVEVESPFERKNQKGEVVSTKDIWKIEIIDIKKCVLPDLDDEFAKDLGDFETLEELKNKISEDAENHYKSNAETEALNIITKSILEKVQIDPPETMVNYYTQSMIADEMRQYEVYGLKLEKVHPDMKKYVQIKKIEAGESVKANLIFIEIIKAEKIEISDEEFNAEIKKLAELQGRKPLAIRAKMEKEKSLDSFRENLVSEKLNKFLLENNKVTFEEVEKMEAEAEKSDSE